jgi:NAD(P)-dependent dehydrogenase (short-subunit alcohol dehydrogenase family)
MASVTIPSLFSVQGKTIVITGGLGQLGRQFGTTLIANGANVAIFDTVAEVDAPLDEIFGSDAAPQLCYQRVDVTDAASIRRGLDTVIERWEVPHGLINNAALDSPPDAPLEENGPFETYPEESWDKIMDVNVKGVFLCCQIVGGAMAESGRGVVINICSTYGLVSPDQRIYQHNKKDGLPFYKPVTYAASKSSLLNLTRYLATYWADRGVRVNTLTFGGVFNNQDDQFLKEYCNRVPLGRMAMEDEYNGAVVFLLSEASAYMTGSNLVIDGGWTAW